MHFSDALKYTYLLVIYISKINICKKAKWLSEEAVKIAVKRRKVKDKGERKRYTQLNAEFQRIVRGNKNSLLNEKFKEIKENNRMGKIRDLFKKLGDNKEHFMQEWA